ncbi:MULTISPECIES: amidohydrolase [unclassified Streptomyces]|uniref:Amidohydrolase n=1 Tax=Streptomyces salyersiae TaxID=3075530 RepID=A0ABU2RGP1_9ACTN|nr:MULTISPECIES: amidohydrolase [unclassified Streptomyces]MYR67242.1 amidohydrolase [Streptomyces sp. SID4939]MYR98834.1 amidohydrolase [Streptomyces sp. SID4940]MYT65262.1 amidohydrolase [Streptomyces sp. SID8357]MYT84862.1 amidohydrolase [Streptomyces sp. SID8360]MYU32730.1 amidohydrolase [Streptomyces sp. SID8358]MYW39442.1 amidohydrolase [Streptomyces sp. SID1]MYX73138.1 amidohydrolase [Streptomyces sp. SID3915]HBF78478.1 amidohydrolase [Streptomyces sp.]
MKSRAPHAEAAMPGTLPDDLRAELIAFRRDMHMHPELGNQEFRTTAAIKSRLEKAGLVPKVLPGGTGLICDVGEWDGVTPMLALRADIDALPIPDTKAGVSYRSTVPDRAHACGHDVHTTCVLGAGLVLSELDRQGLLPYPVRLLFQPAEEVLPGGAADAVAAGVLDGVGRIIGVHCDPKVDVGKIGLRIGPITSACDRVEISLDGPGGHTARPHLTTDLVTAAARVATDVPALLARRVDARAGLAVTWGRLQTGHAPNVIPQHAELSGTVRCLDLESWRQAPDMVHAAIDEVAGMYRAKTEINYVRGVPPVVNEAETIGLLDAAMTIRRGSYAIEDTEQSLGGEDFSWYLEKVPGAMARLGVRTPGDTRGLDLHRGNFDVDEEAITVGVELFTASALLDGNR